MHKEKIRMETCRMCHQEVHREDMRWTYDCHGIPFRCVCPECYEAIMEEKGYDGEYYTEFDENIEENY